MDRETLNYQTNARVKWSWGNGTAEGNIREKYVSRTSKVIKGSEVVRDATKDDPAYLIEQDDGDIVLKSGSELKKVNS